MSQFPPASNFLPPPLPAVPAPIAPASLTEYQYHSQFSADKVGIIVNVGGVLTDPDAQTVMLSMWQVAPPGTEIQQPPTPLLGPLQTTRAEVGIYEYSFTSADTAQTGYFRLDWNFILSGATVTDSTFIEIGPPSPAYDALPENMRQIVEQVWIKFADSFDSPMGGPNLLTWYQSHFGRGRIAQLLVYAVQRINIAGQPVNAFSATGLNADGSRGSAFPLAGWEALVNSALTIEVIKHLMRSYVEDPDIQGNVQARVSRRDYMDRWGRMLELEQQDYKSMYDTFKIRQMFRATPRVLVAGGAYGNYSPVRPVGSVAARPQFWTRFYGVFLLMALSLVGFRVCGPASKTLPPTSGSTSTVQAVQTPVGLGCSPGRVLDTAKWSCSKFVGLPTSLLS